MQLYGITTLRHVFTWLLLREFLKLEGLSVYLHLCGISLPWAYGIFWVPSNFLQEVSDFPYKLHLFWTSVFSDCSFSTEIKYKCLVSSFDFYTPDIILINFSMVSSVCVSSRLKRARYVVLTHILTDLLFLILLFCPTPHLALLLMLLHLL